MFSSRNTSIFSVAVATVFLLGCLLVTGMKITSACVAMVEPTWGPAQGNSGSALSIPAGDLIQPQDLVTALQSSKGEKPLLIFVGFRIPYAEAHIPGSEYFGPAAKPASLQELREHLKELPRNRFIVIYCGCCPWNHCPNVKPAYDALRDLGFTKLKVLYIPENFATDWVDKGYPAEKGE